MERVAGAMSSIVAFLEAGDSRIIPEFQGKFQVDVIEESYGELRDHLRQSYGFVMNSWNSILENELLQQELRECVLACKSFRSTVESFDECFRRNLDLALSVFSNEWIARQYLEMVLKMRDSCSYVSAFVESKFKDPALGDDPYKGAARRFKAYFVGVSDDSLRSLIQYKIPFSHRAKWLGDRREATIFGQTLGLKCSLMNKSFLFCGRDGMPRDLNYSSDGTNLNFNSYDIAPILESLTAAVK